jgi:hypothetical protein
MESFVSRRKNVPGLDSQVGDKLYLDVEKKPPPRGKENPGRLYHLVGAFPTYW